MRLLACRFLLAVLFISCSQTCIQLNAQIAVEEIIGHEDTSAWALHEQSGRIFAAVKSTDSVIEYDAAGQEVRTFTVEAEPAEMILKGDRLVVGCLKTGCFSVIDLKANKVVGKVSMGLSGASRLVWLQSRKRFRIRGLWR